MENKKVIFPESFEKRQHSAITEGTQWVYKISESERISIVGGGFGLYGDGVTTFEMMDLDGDVRGYLTIDQINEYLAEVTTSKPKVHLDGNLYDQISQCTKALNEAGLGNQAKAMQDRIFRDRTFMVEEANLIMAEYCDIDNLPNPLIILPSAHDVLLSIKAIYDNYLKNQKQ